MRTGTIGVAISTTGHEHRMGFLETAVKNWRRVLPLGSVLIVTVDGSAADAERARKAVDAADGMHIGGTTYRVGQPDSSAPLPLSRLNARVSWRDTGRLGVAANKNTGIEILMDTHNVTHLFLSDDDCYPLYPQAVTKHIDLVGDAQWHSMVNWGRNRLDGLDAPLAYWNWPRGVMLYVHRDAVYAVGGMVEEFGAGGNEHVEYSQRMFNAGYCRQPFVSPASYATRNAQGASAIWHCEDMRRPGEPSGNVASRRRAITTLHRTSADWERINAVMARMEGSTAYVGFRAYENGRASATLCTDTSSQGADE